jgi:hypothetical protein
MRHEDVALIGEDRAQVLEKLSRDLRMAALSLEQDEVRYLVQQYYEWQEQRIRASNRMRKLIKAGEPHEVLNWLSRQANVIEEQIKKALDVYTMSEPIGKWCRAHRGVGPVITAGLIAHIDIEKSTSAGKVWAYAGLDPTRKWLKGQKRPFNLELKVLAWKLGASFVKTARFEDAYYGHVYRARKRLEQARNEKLLFKDQAEAKLRDFNIGKDTVAYQWYSIGKLPPAHIQLRAQRYAAKLFLAHFWQTWREMRGLPVELPYPIKVLGHEHMIAPFDNSVDEIPDMPFTLKKFMEAEEADE